MANKALAKRQKLSFRIEPSQKGLRGKAGVRPSQLQPQRCAPGGKPQRALSGKEGGVKG